MSESIEFLEEFLQEMKTTMLRHDLEKGSQWKRESKSVLVDGLYEEIREFEIKDKPEQELIDIANSCFILWARYKYSGF